MYVSVLLLWHHQIMKIACRIKNWLFEGELLALVERFRLIATAQIYFFQRV